MNTEYTLLAIIPIVILLGLILYIIRNHEGGLEPKTILGSIFCLIIVVVAAVPILSQLTTDSIEDLPAQISYDDYYQTKATAAEGSIELIEYDGKVYAHSIGIGEGTLYYGEGSRTVTVEKAVLDVFLLNGQSNMQYSSEMADISKASPVPDAGQAYYFGTPSAPYNPNANVLNACHMQPVTDPAGHANIGRFECPFSAKWTELTGHKILTVNAAVGGRSIESFQPDNGEMYLRTVAAWNAAIERIPTEYYQVNIIGMIWCQGEADGSQSVDWYKTRFNTMLDAFEGDAFNMPIDKCYIDLVTSLRGANARTAQIQIASERNDVKIATTLSNTFSIEAGTMFPDNTHYTQLGQNILGVAVAEYIFSHQ